MMKRLSVQKLNRLSVSREIWCWGTGYRYGKMIGDYGEETFVGHIKGLIDSNSNVQGMTREINKREVKIYSPEELQIVIDKKKHHLIIITCDAYETICNRTEELLAGMDIVVTSFPNSYYDICCMIKKIFCYFPLKRRLLFYVGSENSQPRENADEIIRYLNEEYKGLPYDLVYLTDSTSCVPDAVRQICTSHIGKKSNLCSIIKFFYYYCTSKYILFESSAVEKLRDDQKTVYLNHGTIPLKYVKDALKQPEDLTYAVCPGRGSKKFYIEQYSIDEKKLIYMMQPRVRNIFDDMDKKVDEVFGLDKRQMILWLPTFRKMEQGDKTERNDSTDANPLSELLQSEMIININEILEKNYQKLIIKCHPREKERLSSKKKYTNIIVISDDYLRQKNISTHNMLHRADALVSDYSGITFEYLFLDRPIGYYLADLNKYKRGFSVEDPLHYMPGPKMYEPSELLSFFENLKMGIDNYIEDRMALREELFGGVDPKTGAEELINFLDTCK